MLAWRPDELDLVAETLVARRRTVPVHNPSSRAVGFAGRPAHILSHTWSIASSVNRS